MKIGKYLMVAAASVMMFGCAKDDNKANLADEGPVALTINLENVGFGSKAAVNPSTPSTGTTLPLDKSQIEIKLTATEGGDADWVTVNLADWEDSENNKVKTYYGVVGASKFEVRINGEITNSETLKDYYGEGAEGAEDQDGLGTPKDAAKIPVYNATSTFTPTGGTATDDSGNVYNLYQASVELQIPITRLELSGISYEQPAEGEPDYTSINFDKIEIFEDLATNHTTPLVDEIIPSPANFKTTTFPTANQCYAFNLKPGMPDVRMTFTVNEDEENPYYAVVKQFKDAEGKPIEEFEAGKIYQVVGMKISYENLTPDPTGDTSWAVEVYVTVADWEVVSGVTAEFE